MRNIYYHLHFDENPEVCARRLRKAQESGASHWVCDWIFFHSYLRDLSGFSGNPTVVLLVKHTDLKNYEPRQVADLLASSCQILLEFTPDESSFSGYIDDFYSIRDRVMGLLRFAKNFPVQAYLSNMPVWLRERLSFSPCSELKGKVIYETGKKIAALFPEIHYRPLLGFDQPDVRIPTEVHLLLEAEKKLSSTSKQPQIEISVIIPAYEGTDFLLNVLRHLLRQNMPRDRFEVIVVDDGSPQPQTAELSRFLGPEIGAFNFSYYYAPKKVQAGVLLGSFRAGLCRNFGFSKAQGGIISYLDSDIIVPTNYLETIEVRLKDCDLLQFVRHHIKPSLSTSYTNIEDVGADDFYIEESRYWGPFFASEKWMSIPDYWKYTCTYSLSMRRDTFKRLGRFRKTYVSYGFEDTDFGFTAHQEGLRFHLEKQPLCHLTPFTEKARYKHSMIYKHRLMRTTAKTFFVNHLHPEIYEKPQIFLD